MRTYQNIEEVVVKERKCVKITCEMCGRRGEYPEMADHMGAFEWGGVGCSQGLIKNHYNIDGEDEENSLDLCYGCAEWLMKMIKSGKLKRNLQ